MTFLEKVEHYKDLLDFEIDKFKTASDDELPDIQRDIEQITDELNDEING